MRGLGLLELWAPGGASDADDRCPTLLFNMDPDSAKTASPELITFMKLNQIGSLPELLAIADEILLQMPGFGWRLMKEVLTLRKI